MNRIELMGTVVLNKNKSEIEVKTFESGNRRANFRLACGNDNGQVGFVPIECWNEIADKVVGLAKGSRIKLVGSLLTPRAYTNKDGEKVYPDNVVNVKALAVMKKADNTAADTTSTETTVNTDDMPF